MPEVLHEEQLWPFVRSFLPVDLDESARRSGALLRRRGINSAEALLRMLLAYGTSDLSLQSVASWAAAMQFSTLSTPAFFYRVRDSERWLAELIADLLSTEVPPTRKGLRLRIVDATVVTGPASEGTDWRIHLSVDPASGRFVGVEVTDAHVGEGLGRHQFQMGDVVLADRGYSHATGIAAATGMGAAVVVRINPQTIRLCESKTHQVFNIASKARRLPRVGVKTWSIAIPVPPPRRTRSHRPWRSEDATSWIEAQIHAVRNKTGSVIWILSTLPASAATPVEVMDLYRLRWQVELVFKRLKSLLHLDALPTKKGPTARSWLLARLLAAALAQKITPPSGAFSPWGYVLR